MKEFAFSPSQMLQETAQWQALLQIVQALRNAGFQALLVGGAVRDMLLGGDVSDLDVATDATPEQILPLFEKAIPLGASFGVVTVLMDASPFEVATFRREREYRDGRHPVSVEYTADPAIDALRRDFTVNALFFDPVSSAVLDFADGLGDLRRGIIRTVGNAERRFAEDRLRMLRGVRFASKLGFTLDPETERVIRCQAPAITQVSPERIRDELEKILLHTSRGRAFRMLAETGLLKAVLPEADAMRGVVQPSKYHPEGDVFEHTLLMLTHIAFPTPALMWSVLLHDAAKPLTKTVKDGVPHFYGHESTGAVLAEKILKRLRCPNSMIDSVVPAVRNHMRFACVDKMRESKWKRIAADPNFPLELELHRIDCVSSHGILDNYLLMLDRVRALEEEKKTRSLPPPLLSGRDLIALGMKPGPELGKILREIADLQLENKLISKEDALNFARRKTAGKDAE